MEISAKTVPYKVSHFLAGLITVYSINVHLIFTVLIPVLFVAYEFFELYQVKDEGYPEIRQFLTGVCVGVVFYSQGLLEKIVLNLLGV